MFLENDFARPLFDFEKGGPPKAFQCLAKNCGKITRTERGMRMHLKYVHDWEEQLYLYSTDNLRSHPNPKRKLKLFTKENQEATIKRSLIIATEQEVEAQQEQLQLTEPRRNETNIPKPTREEK